MIADACTIPLVTTAYGLATNNATPWYKNPYIQSALAKGAASTALDSVGLLPEGGAVASAFSLWHGAAAVSNGNKILERVQFGAGLISTANAGSDVQGSEGPFSLSGAQLATGAATIGAGLLKAAPVVGQVISGISVAEDLYKPIRRWPDAIPKQSNYRRRQKDALAVVGGALCNFGCLGSVDLVRSFRTDGSLSSDHGCGSDGGYRNRNEVEA
jgi:hypothetical protein